MYSNPKFRLAIWRDMRKRFGKRYAYISSINDKGRTVLKGPYFPGQDIQMEEDRDKLNRPSNVIYLPTRNIHSASSIVRNDISNEEDIDKASCTRFKYKE